MMCCQACPFNPTPAAHDLEIPLAVPLPDGQGCSRPRCPTPGETCHRACHPSIRFRCFQDEYVVRGLPTLDPLAVMLSPFSLDTACEGRDRRLLVELFHGASDGLRERLWRRLGEHRERALWLINPLLEAAGLPRAEESDLPVEKVEITQREPLYPSAIHSSVKSCGQAASAFGDENSPLSAASFEGSDTSPSIGALPNAELRGPAAPPTLSTPVAPCGTLAQGVQRATDEAYRRLRRAVVARDAEALCDLFLDVPTMLRSALWRYLLLFHAGDLDLLNPLFERHELPPLEPGDVPIELGDYRQALWNVG